MDDPSAGSIVNHIGQCTADVDRAVRFYVEVLGFRVDRTLDVPDEAAGPLLGIEPPVGLRAVYLRRGAFVLELLTFDRTGNPPFTPRAFNEPGLTHLSITVGDLDAVLRQVPTFGGEVVSQLGPRAAVIRDPDGQLLELLPAAPPTVPPG